PGNESCKKLPDADVRSFSIPAESSNPFTTIASDSSSLSKIFTSFSLGSGRRFSVVALRSAITSPVLGLTCHEAARIPHSRDSNSSPQVRADRSLHQFPHRLAKHREQ